MSRISRCGPIRNLTSQNRKRPHREVRPSYEVATRAVIGTLRPTERRRANVLRGNQRLSRMELRGIEPLTSAVRLQRSPS